MKNRSGLVCRYCWSEENIHTSTAWTFTEKRRHGVMGFVTAKFMSVGRYSINSSTPLFYKVTSGEITTFVRFDYFKSNNSYLSLFLVFWFVGFW